MQTPVQTPLCRSVRKLALRVSVILASGICGVLGCGGNTPNATSATLEQSGLMSPTVSHEDEELDEDAKQEDVFSDPSTTTFHKASHSVKRIVSDKGLVTSYATEEPSVNFANAGRETPQEQADVTETFLAMRPTENASSKTGVLIGFETEGKRSGEMSFKNEFESSIGQSSRLSINALASVKEMDHDKDAWIPDFSEGELAKSLEGWSVDRVQLVSLRGGDQTRVYGGHQIPTMKALKQFGVPTRLAIQEEVAAVESLRLGKHRVLGTSNEAPLLVSAVFANESCIQCHKVSSGDLMGALAIRFTASEAK